MSPYKKSSSVEYWKHSRMAGLLWGSSSPEIKTQANVCSFSRRIRWHCQKYSFPSRHYYENFKKTWDYFLSNFSAASWRNNFALVSPGPRKQAHVCLVKDGATFLDASMRPLPPSAKRWSKSAPVRQKHRVESRPSKHTKPKDCRGWWWMRCQHLLSQIPHNFHENAKTKIYLFKSVQKLKLFFL